LIRLAVRDAHLALGFVSESRKDGIGPLLTQAACQGGRPNRYGLWMKNQIRRTTEEIRSAGWYDVKGLYEVNLAISVPADEGMEE
jgi:hypothetical protein